MSDSTFAVLRNVIATRLNISPDLIHQEVSPYGPRQDPKDNISCGVITVEDMVKRIKGQPLDTGLYPAGTHELRRMHIDLVNQVFGVDGFERRNSDRTRYLELNSSRLFL